MAENVAGTISAALLHFTGAIGVLDAAIGTGSNVTVDACTAAHLLIEHANDMTDEIERALPPALTEPEYVHLAEGAEHILMLAANNDRGEDDRLSGLPMGAAWIVRDALLQAHGIASEAQAAIARADISPES